MIITTTWTRLTNTVAVGADLQVHGINTAIIVKYSELSPTGETGIVIRPGVKHTFPDTKSTEYIWAKTRVGAANVTANELDHTVDVETLVEAVSDHIDLHSVDDLGISYALLSGLSSGHLFVIDFKAGEV